MGDRGPQGRGGHVLPKLRASELTVLRYALGCTFHGESWTSQDIADDIGYSLGAITVARQALLGGGYTTPGRLRLTPKGARLCAHLDMRGVPVQHVRAARLERRAAAQGDG